MPPQKTDKVEDDTTSGEDNSDDEETTAENSGVSEYQVPTTVLLITSYNLSQPVNVHVPCILE